LLVRAERLDTTSDPDSSWLSIMTREEILSKLTELQPWFHRIDLGNGVFTKTTSVMGEPVDHPVGVWHTIKKCLPDDLTGKSVVDVGCNAGFYAIEAKRRGANRVLGVDGQRQHIRQAVFVRQLLGLDIEYRRLNVYELTRRAIGEFDITLALGLIYHLKHLVLALENLYAVTRELLIVETAIMPPGRTPESFNHHLGRLVPLAYLDNPPEAKEQVFNWFLPSIEALTALLRNAGFRETEVVDVKDERAVVICRKGTGKNTESLSHHHVASISLQAGTSKCRVNEDLLFTLRVENAGLKAWPAQPRDDNERGVVHLASHLLRTNEEEVAWDYARANLPHDLAPGESAEIALPAQAPAAPGTYVVEFDMVAEHVAWFEDFGSGTLRHELTVL
jgi:tRNA (mo5U34)-methyltransferase